MAKTEQDVSSWMGISPKKIDTKTIYSQLSIQFERNQFEQNFTLQQLLLTQRFVSNDRNYYFGQLIDS